MKRPDAIGSHDAVTLPIGDYISNNALQPSPITNAAQSPEFCIKNYMFTASILPSDTVHSIPVLSPSSVDEPSIPAFISMLRSPEWVLEVGEVQAIQDHSTTCFSKYMG